MVNYSMKVTVESFHVCRAKYIGRDVVVTRTYMHHNNQKHIMYNVWEIKSLDDCGITNKRPEQVLFSEFVSGKHNMVMQVIPRTEYTMLIPFLSRIFPEADAALPNMYGAQMMGVALKAWEKKEPIVLMGEIIDLEEMASVV